MAIRKVFTNKSGKEIAAYVTGANKLFVGITDTDDKLNDIILDESDAIEFILDLYRMRKQLEIYKEDDSTSA